MSFQKLADIFNMARNRYPALAKRIEEAEALGRWNKAVGAAISKHSRAIRVEDSVLWVEVDHPIWKTELHHRKRQILDILNGPKFNSDGKQTLVDILFLDPRSKPRP